MIQLLVIALLRFVPLGLLLVFSVALVVILVRESASSVSPLSQTAYYLVVNKNLSGLGPEAGERWLIDEKIRIGRAEQNQVVIDDPYVSAWHAQIEKRGDELWLLDLNSTNGTMVNGHRISGYRQIGLQDSVAIGGVFLGIERGEMHANCSPNPPRVGKAAE
ncbi:MAG: FHA domain-containing protein [Clostridia bacterium]|nr:FHA domain-containing protein [Clostridia bacterium]